MHDRRRLSISNLYSRLKHVFLNCGYSYECQELETVLKINRLGKTKARRVKLALHLETNMSRLLELDLDVKLLPLAFEILGETNSLSTMFSATRNLSSMALMFRDKHAVEVDGDPMDIEYIM